MRDTLVLIDLENTSLNYVVNQLKTMKNYIAFAFADFSIVKHSPNLFAQYYIEPIQTFHYNKAKNSADFVLLRYAYFYIFTTNIKKIFLYSGDGDFIDLITFARSRGICVNVDSSNHLNKNIIAQKEQTIQRRILDIYEKNKTAKLDLLWSIIKKDIPKLNKVSDVFPNLGIKNMKQLIEYCKKTVE